MKFFNYFSLFSFIYCFIESSTSSSIDKRDGLAINCNLPNSWSGIWSNQQNNKELVYMINTLTESSKSKSNNERLVENVKQLYKTVDEYKFLNKGSCVNNKDERYLFYDDSGKCFRCLFIIQRHVNVIQYRETHCDEEISNFDELCGMISPDVSLITIVREDAIAERCPFSDSYSVYSSNHHNHRSHNNNNKNSKSKANVAHLSDKTSYGSYDLFTNQKKNCFKDPDSSIVTKCPDPTMIKMDFQDCLNLKHKSSLKQTEVTFNSFNSKDSSNDTKANSNRNNHKSKSRKSKTSLYRENDNGLVANCIGHWTEGYWNYLIVKQPKSVKLNANNHIKLTSHDYKCLVYKDVDKSLKSTITKSNPSHNIIQLSLSDDEMCRDFYVSSDGSNSFTLEKNKQHHNNHHRHKGINRRANSTNGKLLVDHRNYNDKRFVNQRNQFYQSNRFSNMQVNHMYRDVCKFPKILNKKWKNLDHSKYVLNIGKHLMNIASLNNKNKTKLHHQHHQQQQQQQQQPISSSSSSSINNIADQKVEQVNYKLECIQSIKPLISTFNKNDIENDASVELEFNAKDKLDYLFLVNNQVECTSNHKCLWISPKSEFLLHIKYGYYDHEGGKCRFNDNNLIFEDYFYADTDQGVNCPFSNRIYQLSNDHLAANEIKASKYKRDNEEKLKFVSLFDVDLNDFKYDCEHYLKIGCNNQFFNDFSIYKKCPQTQLKNYNLMNSNADENNSKNEDADKKLLKKDPKYSMRSLITKSSVENPEGDKLNENDQNLKLKYHKSQINPVKADLETETNRICMAFWRKTSRQDQHESVISNDYDTIQDEYELDNEYSDEYDTFSTKSQNDNTNVDKSSDHKKSDGEDDNIEMSYVVISKLSNSDKFSCSIWESYKKSKKLKITDNELSACIRIIDESAFSTSDQPDQVPDQDSLEFQQDFKKPNQQQQQQQQTRSSQSDFSQSVLNKENQIKIVNNEYSIDSSQHSNQNLSPAEIDSYDSKDSDQYTAQSERLVVADSYLKFQTNEKSSSHLANVDNSIIFDYAGTCTSYKKKSSSIATRSNKAIYLLSLLLFTFLILFKYQN